jgi:hypothetical protein
MTKVINPSNEVGKKYGRLNISAIIIKPHYFDNRPTKFAVCICDCGKECNKVLAELKRGHSRSCGCLHSEELALRNSKHGLSKHPLYYIWRGIVDRCCNPNDSAYKFYGQRGITICDEWRNDFLVFYHWCLDNGWKKGLQTDRINTYGCYEPSNCRFVTSKENNNNRRNNVLFTVNNETKTLSQWSETSKIEASIIRKRIKRGWSIENAIYKPVLASRHY